MYASLSYVGSDLVVSIPPSLPIEPEERMGGDQIEQDAAATCIQARLRGVRSRNQQRKVVAGVTKLQARQRGRFSRREFARLLQFSREQDAFLRATKRRQLCIWRNEQELHFLQHTTAEQLEQLRDFQKKRGARAIQRAWRAYTGPPAQSTSPPKVERGPPIFTFDPFQLQTRQKTGGGERATNTTRLIADNYDNGCTIDPRSLEKDLLGPLRSAPRVPPALLNREAFNQRHKNVQDRIKQLIQSQSQKDKLKAPSNHQRDHDNDRVDNNNPQSLLLSPTKKQANRRRKLYDQLVHLKTSTVRRVHEYESTYRATRASRELLSAKLGSSCENRLQVLQQDLSTLLVFSSGHSSGPSSQAGFSPDEQLQQGAQTARFQAETQQWDAERKAAAWGIHNQIVHAALATQNWWQTSIAGCERDIRKVYAKSPFEHERKVWIWPSPSSGKRQAAGDSRNTNNKSIEEEEKEEQPHASELDVFVFSLDRRENQEEAESSRRPEPTDDREASEWWRAHCMQPHLVASSSSLSHEANGSISSNNNNEDDHHHLLPSSEALANPVFHRLHLESQRRNRLKEHRFAVHATRERFRNRVNQRVGEIEMLIEVNTKMQQDMAQRRLQIKKRRTKEENAVVSIQRVFRGARGRKHASEVRAEYFVMVRGRAIRKGKCEECGEQQAVLECTECEESLHFCPVCWVQVHATRRRKTHVAIPMRVVPRERPVVFYEVVAKKKVVEKPERASGREPSLPALRGPGGAKRVGTGHAKATASKREAIVAVPEAHMLPVLPVLATTVIHDASDRHLVADDDGNKKKLLGQMDGDGDGGDRSCPPVVLKGDASAENAPGVVSTESLIVADTEGGATLAAATAATAAAKPRQKSTTPAPNASKPMASRLSLKQRMGEELPAKTQEEDVAGSSKAGDSASSTRGSSHSLKDDAATLPNAGPPVQSGLKQRTPPPLSAESDTPKVGGGNGTIVPSGPDDGDKPGKPVVKAEPASARLSLKQRMSGSSSVQLEAQRSRDADPSRGSTCIDEVSDARPVEPATGDAGAVAEQAPRVEATRLSATVNGKPEPGVKEEPKALEKEEEEEVETKPPVPVPVAAPAGADSEVASTVISLETSSSEPTPGDQVEEAESRSN